jgi:uncharacterized integral membrane protein
LPPSIIFDRREAMKPKIITGLILGVLIIIILFQNTKTMELQLYFWTISMPKIILILLVLIIGFLSGYITAKIMSKKKNKKISSAKNHLKKDPLV